MDKFDEFLESLKETKSNEKLSEGFKENLVKKMDEEYSKTRKDRFKDFVNKFKSNSLSFSQKFAIVFSLFIIISGVAFGKNIVDWAKEVFSNQDKSVDLAIENGYYQNIDMDYIYHDGVGIKVDYLYNDESCIYIAFNVKTEEQYDEVLIERIELKDQNNNIIFNSRADNIQVETQFKRISKNNNIILNKFYKTENRINDFDILNVIISKIVLVYDDSEKVIEKNWKYSIEMDDSMLNKR